MEDYLYLPYSYLLFTHHSIITLDHKYDTRYNTDYLRLRPYRVIQGRLLVSVVPRLKNLPRALLEV